MPALGSALASRESLVWVLSFVRPHGARLLFVLSLSLVSTALALAQPYLTKFLIDEGLIAGDFGVLLKLSAAMVLVGIVSAVLGGWNRWHYVNVSAKILMALRQSVFAHLLSLSPRYFAKTRGGEVIARLDADVAEVQRFGVDMPLAAVNGVFALTGAIVLMMTLSPRLTLLALVLIPLIALFLKIMRPRVERRTRTVRERATDVTSFFIDTVAAMKLVQSAGTEGREAQRLLTIQDALRQDTLRLQMTNYVTATVPGVLNAMTTAVVFIAGGYMTINGNFSVGSLIAFSAYMVRATGPIQSLLGLYVAYQRALVSLGRINDIRDAEPDVTDPSDSITFVGDASPDIVFDDVSFGYERERPVLRNVSFTLPAASKVLVRGASGVGKTTLIDLLHRHFDPSEGSISVGDVDLRRFQLQSLRRGIAVIAQDTALLSGSIRDNVVYANPEATDAEVQDALARAQLADEIKELPDGINTQVGVRGTALSGGQRQRIAIARALLQSPQIVVLDEATTGVDPRVEGRIIDAVDALFATRTRLIIGHRPHISGHYDFILTLSKEGKASLSRPE